MLGKIRDIVGRRFCWRRVRRSRLFMASVLRIDGKMGYE